MADRSLHAENGQPELPGTRRQDAGTGGPIAPAAGAVRRHRAVRPLPDVRRPGRASGHGHYLRWRRAGLNGVTVPYGTPAANWVSPSGLRRLCAGSRIHGGSEGVDGRDEVQPAVEREVTLAVGRT